MTSVTNLVLCIFLIVIRLFYAIVSHAKSQVPYENLLCIVDMAILKTK